MTNAPSDLRVEQIPVSLRSTSQWVTWRYITRDGKQTKAPVSPHDGSLADSTSSKTWGTFDEAIAVCKKDTSLAGIGFVFTADDPYCGIDLDNSIDANGEIRPWALDLLAKLDSYAEISPSRRGLKIFIKANKPGKRCRKVYHDGGIEIYDCDRFFTVTGERLQQCPSDINLRQQSLDLVYASVFGGDEPGSPAVVHVGPPPPNNDTTAAALSDTEIIALAGKKPRTAISFDRYGMATGTTITIRPAKPIHRLSSPWLTTPRTPARLIGCFGNRS